MKSVKLVGIGCLLVNRSGTDLRLWGMWVASPCLCVSYRVAGSVVGSCCRGGGGVEHGDLSGALSSWGWAWPHCSHGLPPSGGPYFWGLLATACCPWGTRSRAFSHAGHACGHLWDPRPSCVFIFKSGSSFLKIRKYLIFVLIKNTTYL